MIPLTLHFIKNYMTTNNKKKLEHFKMDKISLQITKDDLFILPVSKLIPINCCCEQEDSIILKLDKKIYTCFSDDKCVANNIHRYYWHLFLNNFTVVSKKKIDNFNSFAKYNNMDLWHVGTFKTENEAQLYVSSLFNLKLPLESSYQYSGILGLDKDNVRIVKVSDIVPDCLCINDSDMKSIKDNSTKIDSDLVNFFKNREKLTIESSDSIDGTWEWGRGGWNFYISGTSNSNDAFIYNQATSATGTAYRIYTYDRIKWHTPLMAVPLVINANNPNKLNMLPNPWEGHSLTLDQVAFYRKVSLDGFWTAVKMGWSMKVSGTDNSNNTTLMYNNGSNYNFTTNDRKTWNASWLGIPLLFDGSDKLVPTSNPWAPSYSLEQITLVRQKNKSLDGDWKAPMGWSMKVSGTDNSYTGTCVFQGSNYNFNTYDRKTWWPSWLGVMLVHDGEDKLVPASNPWSSSYSLEQVTFVRQNAQSKIETIKSGTYVSNQLCLKYNIFGNYWTQNINNYALVSYKQIDNYYNFGKHQLKPIWHIKTFRNELDAQYYMNKLFNLNNEPDSIKIGDATFTIIPVSELIPANCCLNSQGMIVLNELNPELGFKSGCVKSWGGNTPQALQRCIDNNIYINYWSENALGYAIVSDKKYKDYLNFAEYKNIPMWHIETFPEFSKAMVALKTKYSRKITNESSTSYKWQHVENGGKTLFNLDKESGDVQCLSYDGKNCLWGFVDAANDNAAYSKRDPVIPLKCGEQHLKQWGSTGYNDTNHWCTKVFNQLMKNSQEAYDYNDWSIYKTQYIDNRKIEPTSASSSSSEPGITIYSEPEYRGKSLFLKPGIYDATFFNNNWKNLGIGSYKSIDNGNYMIGFGFSDNGGAGGTTIEKNLNKWSLVFGGNYNKTIFNGITNFNIWTAEDWKKYMCNEVKVKTYNSHWADFPSSDCNIASPELLAPSVINKDTGFKRSQITRVNMGKNFAISLIVNLNTIQSTAWTEVLSITGIKDELPLKDGMVNSRILSLVITPNTNLLTVIIGDNKNYTTTALDKNNKFELSINTDTLIDIVFSKNKFKIYKNNILFSVAPLSIDRSYPNEAFIYSSYVLSPMKGYFRNLVFISSDGPLTVHDLTLNGVFIDDKNGLLYLFCNNILLVYKFKTNNLEFNDKVNETRFTITNKRKIDIEDKTLLGFEYINPNIITVNNQMLTRYYPKETITINNDSNKTLLRFNNSIYGDIPNQSKLAITNNNFTIEFWYYQTVNEGNNTIIDKGDYEYLISINPNNQPAIGFNNRNMGWWYAYYNVPINTWTHIAITYIKNQSKLSCLVNGTEIKNIILGVANLHSGVGNVNIGRQSPITCACNLLKNALIYDLRIWGISKSQPDIVNNMLNIQKINSEGLISNFLMDDKKDVLIDRINGFNANIINYIGLSNYTIIQWFPKRTEELIDYNITIFSDGIVSLVNINTKLPIITDMKLWSVDINTQKKCKKYLKEPVIPIIKLKESYIINITQDNIIKLTNIAIDFQKAYDKIDLPILTADEITLIKKSLNGFKFDKLDNTNFLFGKTLKKGQNDNDYKYLGQANSYSDCENAAINDNDIEKISSISWFNTQNNEISNSCFGVFNNKLRTNHLGVISGIKNIKENQITNQPIEFMINNPLFKTNSNNQSIALYVSSQVFNIYLGVSKLEIIASLNSINDISNISIRLNTANNTIVARSSSIPIKNGKYSWIIQCINLDAGSYYLDFVTTNNEPFYYYSYELNPKFIACDIKQFREYNNLLRLLQQQGIISQKQGISQQQQGISQQHQGQQRGQQQEISQQQQGINSNNKLDLNIQNLNDTDKKYVSSVLKNILNNHKEQLLIELNYSKIYEDFIIKKNENIINNQQKDILLKEIENLLTLNNPLKKNEIQKLQTNLNALLIIIDNNTKKIEELNDIITKDKNKIQKTNEIVNINLKVINNLEETIKSNPNLNFLKTIISNLININNILKINVDINTRIIEESKIPESKITKISGKYSNAGIEKIEIIDQNNPTVFSGTNDTGSEFTYQCPDNGYIIGYDYSINKSNQGSSIFAGMGPIYCSDGTVIKKKVGKETDSKVGQIPDSIYNKFDYQANMFRTDDNVGIFNNITSENCASICNVVDKCVSFSYNDNKCTLYNNNNTTNLKNGGKTYNKLK